MAQLGGALLAAVEELPPGRFAIALVVVEERERVAPGALFVVVLVLVLGELGGEWIAELVAAGLEQLSAFAWRPLRARLQLVDRRAVLSLGVGDDAGAQPGVEGVGAEAVVAVVELDLAEVCGVAVLQVVLPALQRADRAPQLRVALERVHRLHPLEAIALDARADRLARDAVEVDEHLLAEQVVEFVDAGGVACREPLERDDLVGVVVVDVQVVVLLEAGRDPVDPLLEGGAFLCAGGGPERPVALGAARLVVEGAEEVVEAVVAPGFAVELGEGAVRFGMWLAPVRVASKSKCTSPGDGLGRRARPRSSSGLRSS